MKIKLTSGYGPHNEGNIIDATDDEFAWLQSVGSARELTPAEAEAVAAAEALAAAPKSKKSAPVEN